MKASHSVHLFASPPRPFLFFSGEADLGFFLPLGFQDRLIGFDCRAMRPGGVLDCSFDSSTYLFLAERISSFTLGGILFEPDV